VIYTMVCTGWFHNCA